MRFQTNKTGSDAEGDEDPAANTSADAILRDFRYKLQCTFMDSQRDLKAWCYKKLCRLRFCVTQIPSARFDLFSSMLLGAPSFCILRAHYCIWHQGRVSLCPYDHLQRPGQCLLEESPLQEWRGLCSEHAAKVPWLSFGQYVSKKRG